MQLLNAPQSKWLFCLGVSFCTLALLVLPDALVHFRYDRTALLSGQWWRVITGHLVHLNAAHLAFNLFGLFLICELLWRDLSWKHGCALLFFSATATSALLWWLHSDLAWYAGLSGVLHGLWTGCALSGWWSMQARGEIAPIGSALTKERALPMRSAFSRYFFMGALILLALKLGLEAAYGPSPHTERMIEGSVISVAHLYGALAGIVYVFLWRGIRGLRFRK
jgi:rhomboid family GlyGly-CTERM serine protease